MIIGLLALSACAHTPAKNPDPNHTHADFAIWIDGKQLDFSGEEYMSGVSTDDTSHDEEDEYHHKFLHLHDGNGHVIHRHKPGLTLGEFFQSIDITFSKKGLNLCMKVPEMDIVCEDEAMHRNWVMIVNNEQKPFFDTEYVFADTDKILIELPVTDTEGHPEVWEHWKQMTDDACKYSKTCPWKGAPPTENCIADPEVPCVISE